MKWLETSLTPYQHTDKECSCFKEYRIYWKPRFWKVDVCKCFSWNINIILFFWEGCLESPAAAQTSTFGFSAWGLKWAVQKGSVGEERKGDRTRLSSYTRVWISPAGYSNVQFTQSFCWLTGDRLGDGWLIDVWVGLCKTSERHGEGECKYEK